MVDIAQRAVLNALTEWRQALLDAGVPAESLPLESDLELIAGNPKAEMFGTLGLVRLDAVRKFQPGILSTARTAAKAADGATLEDPPEERPTRRSSQRSAATTVDEPVDQPPPAPDRSDAPSEDPPTVPVAFTPRDVTAPPDEPLRPMKSLHVDQDAGLVIRWDAADNGATCALYRVVTSERYVPTAPEMGDVQTVTTGTEFVDGRPITGALRHVQVWVNRGPSKTAARLAQPTLLSQAIAVVPVTNVDLREDQGWVSCAWDEVPTGIDRVEVLRVPVADTARSGYLPQYLITEDDDCRTGFQDSTCEPGETYEYRIFTVAIVNGKETMTGVNQRVTLSAALLSVDDLRADTRPAGDRIVVDLSWTAPVNAHTVEIFRTERGPEPGVEGITIPVTALGSAGLPAETRLIQPTHAADGRARMTGVAWPAEWDRVYLTPVTIDHDQARVGPTHALTRAGEIHDVRLFPRVDWQLLTLSWPTGASQVQVFLTKPGALLADPPGEPAAQLARITYDKDGGLRLRGVLPEGGCDVHLVPVAFYGGQIYRGRAATVSYGGVTRIRYRLSVESGVKDRIFGGKNKRILEVHSEQLDALPRLVLVHNEQRLPLDVRDGTPRTFEPTSIDKGHWSTIARLQCNPDKSGFLRLFADVNSDEAAVFAVLDPPLSSLRGGVA